MALRNLHSDVMVNLGAGWTEPASEAYKILSNSEDLASFIVRIQTATDAVSVAAQPTPADTRVSELITLGTETDGRHDNIIRGSYRMLTGMALLLGDDEQANEILTLRDQLIPDGMVSITKSYRGEAGQAAQLEARLDSLNVKLEHILVGNKQGKRHLGQYIQEWIELGRTLGEIEDEKAQLAGSSALATEVGALLAARNLWIRTVNAMIATAELAEFTPEQMMVVFGGLWEAEKTADRRFRSKKTSKSEKDEPAPEQPKVED